MTRSPATSGAHAPYVVALLVTLAACTPSGKPADAARATPAASTATTSAAPHAGPVTECRVPQVEGQPYDEARRALLAAGWQPATGAATPADPSVEALRRLGMTEAVSCEASGAGACLMKLKDAQGDTLDIMTIGGQGIDVDRDGRVGKDEMPTVRDVRPTCAA